MKTDLKRIAANVSRLSMLLTRERKNLPVSYLTDPGLREAYTAYFLATNRKKIHQPLAELSRHPDGLLTKNKLRILDIGCGPGTAVLGAMEFFARRDNMPQLEFVAVDQVEENLTVAKEQFSEHRDALQVPASLKFILADVTEVEHLRENRFDIIILSNVLNELFLQAEEKVAKRTEMLNKILNCLLRDDGSCIVIEPALRTTSREMIGVRNALADHGFSVYAPCLFTGACPALAMQKDWCHEDISWTAPSFIQEIDKRAGLRRDSLKFSYFVLRNDGRSLRDCYGTGVFRVVSDPLVSKGKREFYLCGEGSRRLVTRFDKDASTENKAFEHLQRGSIASFNRLVVEHKRCKVEKDTVVRRIDEQEEDAPVLGPFLKA